MLNSDNKAFSSIDFVGQCLVDEERTSAFQKAIAEQVKERHEVLDMGTGSGVLACLAAKAGAKKVTGVEFDPFISSFAKKVVNANHLEETVTILESDARELSFPHGTKFDVVLAEMLTTGMIDEYQVTAINNLHTKKLVHADTIFIPSIQNTFVALAHADCTMHNLQAPLILHLWKWHDWKKLSLSIATDSTLLNSVDFKVTNDEHFDTVVELTPLKSCTVNGIYLTSVSVLSPTISVADTEALNGPVLIPIAEKDIVQGEKIRLRISYVFGGGYGTVKTSFIQNDTSYAL